MAQVKQMTNDCGRPIANQFIIYEDNATTFQSYQTIIAKIQNGKVYLDTSMWDYSKTTGRYRNRFLGEDKKTTEKKIKSGEYILADLNGGR